jgi:hypothetical protein
MPHEEAKALLVILRGCHERSRPPVGIAPVDPASRRAPVDGALDLGNRAHQGRSTPEISSAHGRVKLLGQSATLLVRLEQLSELGHRQPLHAVCYARAGSHAARPLRCPCCERDRQLRRRGWAAQHVLCTVAAALLLRHRSDELLLLRHRWTDLYYDCSRL